MLNLLLESISSGAKDELLKNGAKALGLSSGQTKNSMNSATAILFNALKRNSSNSKGARSLENAIKRDHDGSILDNIGGLLGNPSSGNGAGILRHILGNKQSMVESFLSKENNISSSASSKLLEMLAPIVMGVIGKKMQGQSGINVNSLLNLATRKIGKEAPKNQSLVEKLLDSDNDGSIIDDLANIGMSFLRKKR